MRKHWIDNLRWVTVLLVLLYHVFYFYNNKGVFGGIGGFGEWPECRQYQDVVMYILYPFFMPLLFLLAGISARYALAKYPAKEWFKARTRKLLVPSTIGLFDDSLENVRLQQRDARKIYDIKPGDALMVLGDQRGMALLKTEIFQSVINQAMEGLSK